MSQLFILAIASSASMKEQLGDYFAGKDNVFCKILVDSSDDCIAFVEEYKHDYNVILSCSARYTEICRMTDKPVVRIDILFQDILRSLLMAQNYSGRLAFVGSSPLVQMAHDATELMQVSMEIDELEPVADIAASLAILKERGIGVIIGEEFVSAAAQELGLAHVTVIPGASSVNSAAAQACSIAAAVGAQTKRLSLIQSALSASDFLIVLLSEDGEILYSSTNTPEYAPVFDLINSQPIDSFSKKSMLKLGVHYWSIEKQHLYLKMERVICLFIQKQHYDFEDSAMRGIMVATHSDLSKHEISEGYLDSVPNMHKLVTEARNYAKLPSPTIIFGEAGAGKDIFANIIHKYSHYSENHVIVVDCEMVELPTWAKLLHEFAGIFSEVDVVYYFKNFEQTPAQIQDILCQRLTSMDANNRNKLVFSCNCVDAKLPELPLISFLVNKLHASRIYVSPLRERMTEFGNLSSIYINSLGVELGSQVIGLEPSAVPLLKEYSWPGNLNQFRRFIAELMVSSKGYYISPKTVSTELRREMAENTPENASSISNALDLSGNLEEIERRVIARVLNEEGQNQTLASKRLGISRSTLWRKLKG